MMSISKDLPGMLLHKSYRRLICRVVIHSLFPVLALPAYAAELPTLPSSTSSSAEPQGEQKTARWLTDVAAVAASQQRNEAAQQWVGQRASSALADSAERWLSGYGNARVGLGFDQHFHFYGSSADLLFPLNDTPSRLIFTQWGIHDKDDYTTANLGVGQRWFGAEQMMGYNVFLDQELRNNHSRVGGGIEYWRDYVKLSANGYLALTGWKASKTLTDYQERPASGYDMRSEGYLPAWPQLGGKLIWEQYFGDEVALFGRDRRQRDPYAVTAGVNYTPVPLVTTGVDYKQGKNGTNETVLNMQFNYRFGVPWSQQISSEAVRQRRTLLGSRLDFVERNNTMVMRYKKSEVIKLTLPNQIDGVAGSVQLLPVGVEAKYGLSHIQWRSDALIAAGGNIQTVSPLQYRILLPAAAGVYPVQAVAYDRHGNASESSTLNIISSAQTSPQYHFSLSSNNQTAYNNGNDPIVWTFAVTDEKGASLEGYTAKWDLVEGNARLATAVGQLDKNGKMQNSLFSTAVGKVKLSVSLWDSTGKQRVGEQSANKAASFVTPGHPALRVQPDKVYQRPDGKYAIDWKVHAYDSATGRKADKGLGGYTLQWSSDAGAFTTPTTKTDANGDSTNTVVNAIEGDVTVNVSLVDAEGGSLTQEKDDSAQFTRQEYQVTLHPEPSEVMADGEEKITWTVTVRDKADRVIPKAHVKWETTLGTLVDIEGETDARGESQTTLTSQDSGEAGVKVKVFDADNKLSATATEKGNFLGYRLQLTPAITQAVVGGEGIVWTAEAKNSRGEGLGEGYRVKWGIVSGQGKLQRPTESVLDGSGKAVNTLTSDVAGNVVLKASLLNKRGKVVSEESGQAVSFVDKGQLTLILTPSTKTASADGKSPVEWQVSLAEGQQRKLPEGYSLAWSSSLGQLQTSTTPVVDGKAKNTLTSGAKGLANVTVTLLDKSGSELSEAVSEEVSFVDYKFTTDDLEHLWVEYYNGGVAGSGAYVLLDNGSGKPRPAEGYRVHIELVPKGNMNVAFGNGQTTQDVIVNSNGLVSTNGFHLTMAGEFDLIYEIYDLKNVRVARESRTARVRKMIDRFTLTPSQQTLKADGSDSLTLTAKVITTIKESEYEAEANSMPSFAKVGIKHWDEAFPDREIVTKPAGLCDGAYHDKNKKVEGGVIVIQYQCEFIGAKVGSADIGVKWGIPISEEYDNYKQVVKITVVKP